MSIRVEHAYALARFNATLFPPDASADDDIASSSKLQARATKKSAAGCARWPRCTTARQQERLCQRHARARRLDFARKGQPTSGRSCWRADWNATFRHTLRYARLLAGTGATIGSDPPIISDRLYAEAFFAYELADIAAVFYLNRTGMPHTLGMPDMASRHRRRQPCARPLDSASDAHKALRLALKLECLISAILAARRAPSAPLRRLPVLRFVNGAECHNGSAAVSRIDSGGIRPLDGTGFAPPPLAELRAAAVAARNQKRSSSTVQCAGLLR
jgi:hypothetical protein